MCFEAICERVRSRTDQGHLSSQHLSSRRSSFQAQGGALDQPCSRAHFYDDELAAHFPSPASASTQSAAGTCRSTRSEHVTAAPKERSFVHWFIFLRPIRELAPFSGCARIPRQAAKRAGANRMHQRSLRRHRVIRRYGCREFSCPKGVLRPNVFAQAVRKTASASYP